ncbi:short-chain collagen C4-like [Ylistrum balloti]|uniref:short-chain collagen C4-like n=1 Tax=Ylistrum balloti TaxID=509963 RepID=UPI002905F528|nr:short-chain collagen C4-like [Ylistrum balloti]
MVTVHIPASFPVIILNTYMLVVIVCCNDNIDKRILISDPAYVQQQITHLQSELQTLQATVQTKNADLQTLQATVQSQAGKITQLEQQLSDSNHGNGGATFIRWGRSDCPDKLTELVYSGYAGGSWYADTGAAANYLCLPSDPEWLNTTVVPNTITGKIYGTEYESYTGHTLFGSDSHDEEAPCAVCRSTSFVSSVMIPARTSCYSGWTRAYSGSLASGYSNQPAASEYVCVDEQAQPLSGGGDTNDNGALFYGVRAFCGALRCPPYKQDKYVACVVCMK